MRCCDVIDMRTGGGGRGKESRKWGGLCKSRRAELILSENCRTDFSCNFPLSS